MGRVTTTGAASDTVTAGPPTADPGGGRNRGVRRAVLAVLMLAALLAAFAGGRASLAGSAPPPDDSPEAGFARDMQDHHAQAVEMSLTVRDRTGDEATRRLAYDILTTQQQQIGQMYGWLVQWDLSQVGEPMAWMAAGETTQHGGGGHGSGTAGMPGMASAADLARLRTLGGVEAERLFLQLMISHHRGGVEMARAVLDRSPRREVQRLAGSMAAAQNSEITVMERMLAARGG